MPFCTASPSNRPSSAAQSARGFGPHSPPTPPGELAHRRRACEYSQSEIPPLMSLPPFIGGIPFYCVTHPNRPGSAAQSARGFGPHSPPGDLQARLQGVGRANIRKAKFRFFAPAVSLCDSCSQMQSRRFSYSSPYKRTAEGENGGRKSPRGFFGLH